MIPEAAVEAAAIAVHNEFCRDQYHAGCIGPACYDYKDEARNIIEAAAPHMLSHEREETRLAHLDAVVNAASLSKYEEAIQHLRDLADNAERDRDYVKVVDAAAIHAAIDDTLGE